MQSAVQQQLASQLILHCAPCFLSMAPLSIPHAVRPEQLGLRILSTCQLTVLFVL